MSIWSRLTKSFRTDSISASSGGFSRGVPIRDLGPISRYLTEVQNQTYTPSDQQTIEGVDPKNWPSALQPIRPMGVKGSQPLVWPVNYGLNLQFTPRGDSRWSAGDLRKIAQYPLASICIENIINYTKRTPWAIQPKSIPGETERQKAKRGLGDENLVGLSRFFEYPDGENDWSKWVQPILNDELTLDAPSILVNRSRTGRVTGLEWTDGASITRLITDRGRTPTSPSPAYYQVWNGMPRVYLTQDQLVYRPANICPRPDSIASYYYGKSVTETVAQELVIGAKRLDSVLAYYERGSVPGLVHFVPAGVDETTVIESMKALNSRLAGNLERRRQWQMIQGFKRAEEGAEQILQLADPMLSDAFDEQHLRRVCMAYGVSPQRMVRALNRAASESMQEASEEEGSGVWLDWLGDLINYIIQRVMGFSEYEFVLQPRKELDPQRSAVTHQVQVANAQRTINEVREEEGKDPYPFEIANKPGFMVGAQFIPLDQMEQNLANQAAAQQMQLMMGDPAAGGLITEDGEGEGDGEVEGEGLEGEGEEGPEGSGPGAGPAAGPGIPPGAAGEDRSQDKASRDQDKDKGSGKGKGGKGVDQKSKNAKAGRGKTAPGGIGKSDAGVPSNGGYSNGGHTNGVHKGSAHPGPGIPGLAEACRIVVGAWPRVAWEVLSKYDPGQPRDQEGRWTERGGTGRGENGSSRDQGYETQGNSPNSPYSPNTLHGSYGSRKSYRLTRSERASLTHKPSTRAKQIVAISSEQRLAKELGLDRSPDNRPFDLMGQGVGIEVKTILDNSNNKITMHPESLARKRSEAERLGITPWTVVIDRRGPDPVYYYREGVGSFYLRTMEKAGSSGELRDRVIRGGVTSGKIQDRRKEGSH